MTCVLGFLPLTGLCIEIGLKSWIDISDFYTIEIEGGERMTSPIVAFPVVTVGSR